MSEVNDVDFDALNKLNKAFIYAIDASNRSNAGDDAVIYLEDGQQLNCTVSQDDAPKTLMHFRRTRTDRQIQLNNETRDLFRQMVIDIFGTSIDDVPKSVRSAMELSKFDNTGRPLTARRIMAVNKAILSAMKSVNKLLGLSGSGAVNIAMIAAKGSEILSAQNPSNELMERTLRHVKAEFQTHIAKRMSVLLKDDARLDETNGALIIDNSNSQFFKDLQRKEIVTLKGKRMTVDAEKSRDELVQFITGQKTATFNGSDNQTKLKACLLMTIVQQGAFACIIEGVGLSFDPQGKRSRINPGSMHHFGGTQTQSFSLTKDKNGNIKIAAKIRYTAPVQLGLVDDQGQYHMRKTDSKDAYVEYNSELIITSEEFDRLSSVDWANLDTTEMYTTETNEGIPNRYEEAAALIPDEFKFTGDVKASCHIHAQEVTNL